MSHRTYVSLVACALTLSAVARAQVASQSPSGVAPAVLAIGPLPTGNSPHAVVASNLVINGDFETHTGSGCQYNFDNASFGLAVSDVTAYGPANELDLMEGACYGLLAYSGATKLGMHTQNPGAGSFNDAIAFTLSSSTVAGSSYKLTYWAVSDTTFDPMLGQIEVGLSTNPSAFGTLIYTGALTTTSAWTQFQFTFTAPLSAGYLTVRTGIDQAWIHVDDFSLESACPAITNYCTAGTTSHGCLASMSASGTASAGATSGFTLTCSSVEGQKTGLMFYGISGRVALPWGLGSSSFLCVKPPTQRMLVHSSGGTSGACDGTISEDFLAFAANNPGSLGTPLTAGLIVDAQCWFRDPPSAKSTSLSDGLEFTLCP